MHQFFALQLEVLVQTVRCTVFLRGSRSFDAVTVISRCTVRYTAYTQRSALKPPRRQSSTVYGFIPGAYSSSGVRRSPELSGVQ